MKISMIVSAALLLGATAFAADVENKTTADTSKNPVTGTVTKTMEHTEKAGDAKAKVTKKTKKHKDGSTETKTEVKTETPATH
jgi:hypothetical protein